MIKPRQMSCFLLFFGLMALLPGVAFSQGIGNQHSQLEAKFQKARAYYNDFELVLAATLLTNIAQDGWAISYPDEARPLLIKTYALHGICNFNLGNIDATEDTFEELVRLEPNYRFDSYVPTKIVEYFDKLRKSKTGMLVVTTNPSMADINIGGHFAGQTPLPTAYALEGSRLVRVEKRGYETMEETIVFKIGETVERQWDLTPTARNAIFFTSPPGVEIKADGVSVGHSSGHVPDRHKNLAEEHGINPNNLSAPFVIEYLTVGNHRIEFVKECYKPQSLDVEIHVEAGKNDPLFYEPVALEKSTTSLSVLSSPTGLDLIIDGQLIGPTPYKAPFFCAGKHDIRVVQKGVGEWRKKVNLKPDTETTLRTFVRPTLVFLGIWRDAPTPTKRSQATIEFNARLEEDNLFNIVLIKFSGAKLPKPSLANFSLIAPYVESSQADLYLLGVQDLKGTSFYLYSGNRSPDLFQSEKAALRALRAPFSTKQAELGITVTDLTSRPGAAIINVALDSPAAQAGLTEGKRIVSINDKSIENAKEFRSALARLKDGTAATFGLSDGTRIEATPVSRPRMLPLEHGQTSFNKFIPELKQQAALATKPVDKALLHLNMGICYYRVGDYDAAIDILQKLEFPNRQGLNQGTVDYILGLCHLKAGNPLKAKDYLTLAAANKTATLDSDYGFSVAPLARRISSAL